MFEAAAINGLQSLIVVISGETKAASDVGTAVIGMLQLESTDGLVTSNETVAFLGVM